MRKPRFVNRPEDVTVHDGKPRKKHRSLTKDEIIFLKNDMYIRWSKNNDYGSILWNFEKKFGWKPLLNTIKWFYQHKTYQWVWEDDFDSLEENKSKTREYQLGTYDEYKDDIILALKDPYFGSCDKNFDEFLKVFCPKVKNRGGILQYLRKKYNVKPIQTERTHKIVSTILENKALEKCELYELLKKEFDLSFCKFNYYCKKAGLKETLTENGYKRYCKKRKENSLHVTSVEVRYNIDGKFYVEQIELPKTIINSIKKGLLKKL